MTPTRMTAATGTPKQPFSFHPGLCPSQRGPEFAGEGAEIHSNRRLNGSHAAGVMPLNRDFWDVTLGIAQGRQVEEREAAWRIDRD
jgi:hypothetical protein